MKLITGIATLASLTAADSSLVMNISLPTASSVAELFSLPDLGLADFNLSDYQLPNLAIPGLGINDFSISEVFNTLRQYIPVPAVPLAVPSIELAQTILSTEALKTWDQPPVESQECLDFYTQNPTYKQAYEEYVNNKTITTSLITDPRVIEKYSMSELTCLNELASPAQPLKGMLQGRTLSNFGHNFVTDLANSIWAGKIMVETQCPSGPVKFAVNIAAEYPSIWALNNDIEGAGEEDFAYGAGEFPAPGTSSWLSYNSDINAICENVLPDTISSISQSEDLRSAVLRTDVPLPDSVKSYLRGVLPNIRIPRLVSQDFPGLFAPSRISARSLGNPVTGYKIIDTVRVIGENVSDKYRIYLGRVYVKFSDGFHTVGWYTLTGSTE